MMIDILVTPFVEFSFMRRALAGCMALSVGAAPVGVILVLRRMSLTGDAMAHGVLPGIATGFLLFGLSVMAMTIGGIIAGLAVALLAGFTSRVTIMKEDASFAAFYLISLAAGVLLISTRGGSIDLIHVLFGTVLALDDVSLLLIGGICTLSLSTVAAIYRPLIIECADPGFFRSVTPFSGFVHYAFLALVVLCLVGGFQAVGSLMAIGIMVLPAASSRFWAREVPGMICVAIGLALMGSLIGLLLSYHWGAPSGPSVILVIGAIYLTSMVAGRFGSLRVHYWPGRHLAA